MEEFVFNHDFGYGKEKESALNKLTLKDFLDVQLYVESHIRLNLDADIKENEICYLSGKKEIFSVEKCKNKK